MTDRPHENQNEGECWCGPQHLHVAEGTLWLHYSDEGEHPPAAIVIQALAELLLDDREDGD